MRYVAILTAVSSLLLAQAPGHMFLGPSGGGHVSLPAPITLSATGPWTVDCWRQFPDLDGQFIRSFPGARLEIDTSPNSLSGDYGLYIWTPAGNSFSGHAPITPGWHHVAVTASGGMAQLWVDGQPHVGVPIPGPVQGDLLCRNFGAIDEFHIWSVALTQSELMNIAGYRLDSVPGLVHSYHFDNGAIDTTGGLHGTIMAPAAFVPSTAPVFPFAPGSCGGQACLHAQGSGGLSFYAACNGPPNAPLFVLVDTVTGSIPLLPGYATQIAFSPNLAALADPFGYFSGVGPIPGSVTNATGWWSVSFPLPAGFSGLTFYLEAYVLDFFAPNNLFWQSNLETVVIL